MDDLTDDKIKKTIILRSILEQIRGISSKALMFLQLENESNNRNLDDSELIFVDRRAIRVAKRVDFPFYENDLVEAIRKFGGKYNLTANQIDMALYHMGDVCSASGCLHGNEYKCIFLMYVNGLVNKDNVPFKKPTTGIYVIEPDVSHGYKDVKLTSVR